MIDNLEELFKDILPEKQQNKKAGSDIETFLVGEHLSENVFLHTEMLELEYQFSTFSQVIKKYCKIDDTETILFFDTETTGLAGGTGTIAFLVGVAECKVNQVTLYQYFLKDLSDEVAMLSSIVKKINSDSTLISYNGKSFDLHLLNSRLIMNGFEPIPSGVFHIDLLHIVRRLWKHKLEKCDLKSVEKDLLKKERDNLLEIPGHAIPQEYFSYLETRDAKAMQQVMYHNKIDVLSLIDLLHFITKTISRKPSELSENEIFALAKWHEDVHLFDKSIELYHNILNLPLARKNLSYIYKKEKEWKKALPLWKIAAEENELYAMIELAKYEEHVQKNTEKALIWTEGALKLCKNDYWSDSQKYSKLMHRKKRLKKFSKNSNTSTI